MRTGLIGNREKAIVHIAKQQLGLTETEYRAALQKIGVASSKNLTFPQYEEFLKTLKAAGFVLNGKKKAPSYIPARKTTWDKDPLMRKIGALLMGMKLSWNYADGIARRMFKVDCVSWCVPDQLHSIVAALEYKRRRMN
jgi:phage gp16-like protein